MSRLRLALAAICVAIGLTLAAGTAAAQDESLNKARQAFDEAQTFYSQGKYAEAAEKFLAAYEARPFAQFLFNAGAAYEKMREYAKAVDHYRRYLEAEPRAEDRAEVEKRIAVLEKEAERRAAQPPPDQTDPDAPPPDQPSAEVEALGDVTIRGLVVIESDPAGADIYVDDKKKGVVAKTPWSTSLEGEHTIFIEKPGYKPYEKRIAPSPEKLLILSAALSEEDYLGWIEIKSNIPGADIYIDDKAVGVKGKTPYSGNLPPGKHKIWVTTPGYDEIMKEVDIVAGETHELDFQLEGTPVGYLNIRGRDVEHMAIYVDGELLCERGPCRKPIPEGARTVTIRRSGYKPYTHKIDMQAKTEVTLRARLAEEPGRADAVWAYVFSAAFLGGGIYLGLQANGIEDELRTEIAAGLPPPDNEDPRVQRGKYYAWGADAAYALSGISLATAVYYTFREKGAPSTGTTDVRAVAFEPQFSPTYAGMGMEVRW